MRSKTYPSSHQYRSYPKTSHSGGSLESTGAIYKSLSGVPEYNASSSSKPTASSSRSHDNQRPYGPLNSVVEIGQDPLHHDVPRGQQQHQAGPLHDVPHGQYQPGIEPLSVDGGERTTTTHGSNSLVRESQQRALAMAGFACNKEYEQRSKPPSPVVRDAVDGRSKTQRDAVDGRSKTLEMAGFIESRGTPQPLISGSNYTTSSRSKLVARTAEPSDLIGQHDVKSYESAAGNKSLPRHHHQGALLPQASQVSTTGVKYPQGYRKPQNGGGAAPQVTSEANRTFESTGQKRQLIRHESWSGRTANSSQSVPIYENVVNGNVAPEDSTDGAAEGNVTSQGRHTTRYSSVPDLQRRLSDPVMSTKQQQQHQGNEPRTRHMSDNQFKQSQTGQNIGMYENLADFQNQLASLKLNGAKENSVRSTTNNKQSVNTDIYSSMPDLQRSPEHVAPLGLLANAIRNNQEHRKTLDRVASNSSMSSLGLTASSSSSSKGLDSKRSSQASQASTFTTDSADTSRSSGSRSGSVGLRNKYVASGFVTLPRKKRVSDFAASNGHQQQPGTTTAKPWFQRSEGQRNPAVVLRSQSEPTAPVVGHMAPRLQQQSSVPAQFAGVFIDDDDTAAPASTTTAVGTTTTITRRPSHLQHFTTNSTESTTTTTKPDPLEVGSVGSKDSGYRSRDRSSASSGSVYSVDSPVAETAPPQFGMSDGGRGHHAQFAAGAPQDEGEISRGGSRTPTSPDAARKQGEFIIFVPL